MQPPGDQVDGAAIGVVGGVDQQLIVDRGDQALGHLQAVIGLDHGLGGAVNGLSEAHRDFLAAGGNGLLIGDGALNYRLEKILETYYAFALGHGVTFTADYQWINNPAYNADRGPVSIFSGRVHAEF